MLAKETREFVRQRLLAACDGTTIKETRKSHFTIENEAGFSFVFLPGLTFKYRCAIPQPLVALCHPHHGPRLNALHEGDAFSKEGWEPKAAMSYIAIQSPVIDYLETDEDVAAATLDCFSVFLGWEKDLLGLTTVPAVRDFFEELIFGPLGEIFHMYADSLTMDREAWCREWQREERAIHQGFSKRLLADPDSFKG